MRDRLFMKLPSLLLRVTLLGSAFGLLTGCVAPLAYVQPDVVGSGSYYTDTGSYSSAGYYSSDEPYTGAGYYDEYGTGPYYSGTDGWGYYNGSFPYAGGFGYFGGYGTWPVFFNMGFSSVWDFPGYWGPWYTTVLPFWSDCRRWRRCDGHRHYANQRHHGHHRNANAVSSRPWLHRDRPRVSPLADASRVYRPGTDIENRRLGRADAFAHDRFVHAPVGRTIPPSFRRVSRTVQPHFRDEPIRPMDRQQSPNALWANRVPTRISEPSRPRDFRPMPRAAYAPTARARSSVSRPVIAPRSRHHSRSKIP